jgi:hypothetical protein
MCWSYAAAAQGRTARIVYGTVRCGSAMSQARRATVVDVVGWFGRGLRRWHISGRWPLGNYVNDKAVPLAAGTPRAEEQACVRDAAVSPCETHETSKNASKTLSTSPEVAAGTAQEPLACPFCGGRAYATRTVNGTQMFKVGCASCGIEMKAAWYRDEPTPTKDILSLWNQRTPADAAGKAKACPGCGHAWHDSYCPVVIGPGETSAAADMMTCHCIEHEYRGDAAGTPREEEQACVRDAAVSPCETHETSKNARKTLSTSPEVAAGTAQEPPQYTSGCTEPEFQPWWEQFGSRLHELNRETLALAAFAAGVWRGRMREREAALPSAPAPPQTRGQVGFSVG